MLNPQPSLSLRMNIAPQLHSGFPCWARHLEEVEADIMRRMSGKNTLRKLRKEGGWGCIPNEVFEPLEAALQVLEDDLNCAKKEPWELLQLTIREISYVAQSHP